MASSRPSRLAQRARTLLSPLRPRQFTFAPEFTRPQRSVRVVRFPRSCIAWGGFLVAIDRRLRSPLLLGASGLNERLISSRRGDLRSAGVAIAEYSACFFISGRCRLSSGRPKFDPYYPLGGRIDLSLAEDYDSFRRRIQCHCRQRTRSIWGHFTGCLPRSRLDGTSQITALRPYRTLDKHISKVETATVVGAKQAAPKTLVDEALTVAKNKDRFRAS